MGLRPLRSHQDLRITDDAISVQSRPKWSQTTGQGYSNSSCSCDTILARLDLLCRSIEEVLDCENEEKTILPSGHESPHDSLTRTFELDNVVPECFTADLKASKTWKWSFRFSSL